MLGPVDRVLGPVDGGERGSVVWLLVLDQNMFDLDEKDPERHAHLGTVALDEIAAAAPAPLHLPAGTDPRLRRLTVHLGRNPSDGRSLPELAAEVGASPRTLERLFRLYVPTAAGASGASA